MHLPELVRVGFDSSIFWRSLESYDTGDTIEHEGVRYVVRYGWLWWHDNNGTKIYMAELDIEGAGQDE